MRSLRRTRLTRVVGPALLLSLLASSALAQAAPWDQKRVTAIAVKLEQALRDLRLTVRRNPQVTATTLQRRVQFQARESLRSLVTTSQRLASQLRAGEGLDATLPIFRRLLMFRRDAEQAARRANLQAPTLERIATAQKLIEELMPFYGQAAAEEEAAEKAADAAETAPAGTPPVEPTGTP